jgi:hypothetical protein
VSLDEDGARLERAARPERRVRGGLLIREHLGQKVAGEVLRAASGRRAAQARELVGELPAAPDLLAGRRGPSG